MPTTSRPAILRHGVAVGGVLLASLARWLLDPILGDHVPFATYFAAILATAWYGGLGPSLLAVALGALSAVFLFVPPRGTLALGGAEHQLGVALYFVVGFAIALMSEALQAARRRAEREAAEAAQSREWLRVTLASVGDAVIAADPRGCVTFTNFMAQSLTGWTQDKAVGQPLERVFDTRCEDTGQSGENPMTVVRREGKVFRLGQPRLLVARDGAERLIDDSVAPIRNDRGEIVGAVLVFRDITERRFHEEATWERARQLQLVTDNAPVLIAHCDRLHRFRFVNKPYADRFGLHPRDIIGKTIPEVIGQEAYAVIAPHIDAALAGRRVEFEAEVPYRGIGTQHMQCAYQPEFDASGQVVGYVAAIINITERKRIERALREEARITETLYRVGRTLAAELDLEKIVQAVTDEATALTEARFGAFFSNVVNPGGESYTLFTLSGASKTAFERFPMPRNTAIFESTFRGQGVVRLDDVTQDPRYGRNAPYCGMPEGHLPVKSYLAVPVVSRGGDVLGGLFFGHPEVGVFTARHERLIVGIAAQAAVAIDHARLVQALKEADRRKDEFLALLGHELRNPLAPLRNALHVMKLPGADAAVIERAREMMERQLQQLGHLVDDLLDVSRIMRGRVDLRKEPVELATVVARAVETAQPTIDIEGHQLSISLPPEPLWVDGDLVRLAQVVSNLLNNAAKYTERGGRIWLRAGRESDHVLVCVRDTGIGIAPTQLGRIFDMFYQAQRREKHAQGGLGIGLSLVRGLVELHGGSVEARSAGPGTGSEFIVRLPALTQESGVREQESGVRSGPSAARRVLVVDDSPDAAESLAMLLRLHGQDVRVAYDGLSALEQAEADPPEVAFLDLGMPRMDGYELARRFRKHPRLKEVLLVALTGWGQPEDRRRSRAAGFDHHLVKPVEPETLVGMLEQKAGRTAE